MKIHQGKNDCGIAQYLQDLPLQNPHPASEAQSSSYVANRISRTV